MKYLWIVLAILAVLSPLMWLRPSPGQLRVSRIRRQALALGLQVQLVPAADAEASEKHPDCVRYLLSTSGLQNGRDAEWVLLRSERRGEPSPWPGWRWFRSLAPVETVRKLGAVLESLPDDVQAICRDRQGISIYWLEKGGEEQLLKINSAMKKII